MNKIVGIVACLFVLFLFVGCTVGGRTYPKFNPADPLLSDDFKELGYSNYSSQITGSSSELGTPSYSKTIVIAGTDTFKITSHVYASELLFISEDYKKLSEGMQKMDTNYGTAAQSAEKAVLYGRNILIELSTPSAEKTTQLVGILLKKIKKGVETDLRTDMDKAFDKLDN